MLTAADIQELIIRAGRHAVEQAEAQGVSLFQHGSGKLLGKAGEHEK